MDINNQNQAQPANIADPNQNEFEELVLDGTEDTSSRLQSYLAQDKVTPNQISIPNNPEGTIYLNTKNEQDETDILQERTPVGGILENPTNIENMPHAERTTNIETYIAPEFDGSIGPEQADSNKQITPANSVPMHKQEPEANVVDMRTAHEKLYNVSENADLTTKDADEKEDYFIKKVEDQHEHKQ